MNPMAAPPPPTLASSQISPTASALHPPSVQHNARVLSSLATLAACFSGLTAGILGLTNLSGFLLYLFTSFFSATTVGLVKCRGDVSKFVPQAYGAMTNAGGGQSAQAWKGWVALSGLGQENLLGFLLFWIGGYALIHVYD